MFAWQTPRPGFLRVLLFFVVTLDHNSLIPIPCSIPLLITNTISRFVYQCDFDSFYYLIIISFSNSSSLLSSIRIQWLRKGSRELFGTIIEDQVRFYLAGLLLNQKSRLDPFRGVVETVVYVSLDLKAWLILG